jgi:hypothetical protein
MAGMIRVLEDGVGLENAKQRFDAIVEVAERQIRAKQTAPEHHESMYLEYEHPLVKERIAERNYKLDQFFINGTDI